MLCRVQPSLPRTFRLTPPPSLDRASYHDTQWHAPTAEAHIKWTEIIFNKAFKDKPLDKVDMNDLTNALGRTFKTVDKNPRTRTFSDIKFGPDGQPMEEQVKRGPDGRFSDDDLARVLQDATEQVAGAYRARGSPAALRIIEIMSMIQARKWGVCTMNEFREWFGLKRFESFEEWNPDKEIAVSLIFF